MNTALETAPPPHHEGALVAPAQDGKKRTIAVNIVARKRQTEYVYERPEHDHAWEALYALDTTVPADIHAILEHVCQTLRSKLLPKLGLFSNFQAAFVEPMLFGPYLGKYVEDTYSMPCIALNYDIMNEHQAISNLPIELWLETTIVHELAHACQDACGMQTHGQKAEELAEQFAYEWQYAKRIPELLEKARMMPARTVAQPAEDPAIPHIPLNITPDDATPDPRNQLHRV